MMRLLDVVAQLSQRRLEPIFGWLLDRVDGLLQLLHDLLRIKLPLSTSLFKLLAATAAVVNLQ